MSAPAVKDGIGAALDLFGRCAFEPEDLIELRAIGNNGQRPPQTWIHAAKLPGMAARLEARNHDGFNVYVGANPRTRDGGSTAADVAIARCLFVDADGVTPEELERRIIEDAALPAPTLLIDSGHGAHAYWRLAEPIIDLAIWTAHQKALIAKLGTDPAIHDPPRIMRLPGLLNVKGEPVPCRIVRADLKARYSLDEFPQPIAHVAQSRPTAAPAVNVFIVEGERNRTLASLAGSMRRRGMSTAAIEAALRQENGAKCKPPLPEGEVEKIARSVARYTPADPAGKVAPESDRSEVAPNYDPVTGLDYDAELASTDTGNARRFADRHAEDVRYCPALGWLVWDGTRWAPDETGRAVELAKALVSRMLSEIVDAPLEKDRQKLARWALRSAQAQRIEAMLKLARSDTRLVVRHQQLDADPWLLNCPNGTINLRTGERREHRREDCITKRTAAPYNPEAESARWDRFLGETTGGDPELLEFIRRAIGYSITGGTAEEVLFLVHGPTAAGKSTFIESIRAGLGDYCRTADFSTFLRRRDDGPRNDIARLAGSRVVVSIEVEEGRRLAEGLVKQLTGGDTVAARFLYRESFEFKPAFKLWLVCNDAPRVSADDSAIWRRMLRLPFDRTVPEADRDPTLKAGFCDPDGEDAGAILAWCVAGCLEYQRRGLDVPERVKLATAEYRAAEDLVARFLEDRCHTDDRNAETLATGLYKAFRQFCKEAGEVAPSQTAFGRSMTEKGHLSKRAGSGRMVRNGIELRQEDTLCGG